LCFFLAVRDIEDEFRRYGKILDIWIARNPPGFAFIDYENPRDAQDAVKGEDDRVFLSTRIKVEISRRGRKQYERNNNHNNASESHRDRDRDIRDRDYRDNRDRDRDRGRASGGNGRNDRQSRSRSRDRPITRDRDHRGGNTSNHRPANNNNKNATVRIRTAHRIKIFNLPLSCDWKALKAFIVQMTSFEPAFVDVLTPTEGTVEFYAASHVPKAIEALDQSVFPSNSTSTNPHDAENDDVGQRISVIKDDAPVQDIRVRPVKAGETKNSSSSNNNNGNNGENNNRREEEENGKATSFDRRQRDRSRSGEPAE
jgi:hypothetical protein